jgi:hypothetical protein
MDQINLSFWKNQPGGLAVPASYEQELDVEYGVGRLPKLDATMLERKYPPELGFSIQNVELNSFGDLAVVVTKNGGDGYQVLTGLPAVRNYEQTNQVDLSTMLGHLDGRLDYCVDYFFYAHNKLLSLKELHKFWTGWELELFCFNDGTNWRDAEHLFLTEQGKVLTAIFAPAPTSIANVGSGLHEAGHSLAYAYSEDRYAALNLEVKDDPDIIQFQQDIYAEKIRRGIGEEITEKEQSELIKYFSQHPGLHKVTDFELRIEMDAWMCEMRLVRAIGLSGLLSPRSPDFNEFMMYLFKSRLENLEI